MAYLTATKAVRTLMEALVEIQRARRPQTRPEGQAMPFDGSPQFIHGTGSSLQIHNPPTLQELKMLATQERCLSLFPSRGDEGKGLALLIGSENELILPTPIPHSPLIITLPFSQNPGDIFSNIRRENALGWGFFSSWYVISPSFVARIENLSNERDSTEFEGEKLKVKTYRRSLPAPSERLFTVAEREQYPSPGELYTRIVKAICGERFGTSFVIDGIPRVAAVSARARVYFLTWEDFQELFERSSSSNFYEVFNTSRSWMNLFID